MGPGVGAGIGQIGQGVSDFYSANALEAESGGYGIEGNLYESAANIAKQNRQIEQTSVGIQTAQQQRQAYRVIGSQRAAVAANGFGESGSSLYLLRESTQQSNLAKSLLQEQGMIQENTYSEEAAAYTAQSQAAFAAAKAAKESATGMDIAGVFSVAGGIASIAAA